MKPIYPLKISVFISLFLILSNLINAQVVYTDVTPDYIINNPEYPIDLNNDGQIDLSIIYTTYGDQMYQEYETALNLNENISIIKYSQKKDPDIFTRIFNHDDTIKTNSEWEHHDEIFTHIAIDHMGKVLSIQGGWDTINMGYLALRLEKNSEFYYGWLRLYYTNNFYHNLALADFAINSIPNEEIIAGNEIPNMATSLTTKDVDDYMDGRDVEVNFTRAIDESLFSEYRIIIAKSDDENTNDIEYMSQLSEEYYYPILMDTMNQFNVTQKLFEHTKSIDGETIIPFTEYQFHILNVSHTGDINDNMLSIPSDTFEIAGQLEPVYQIYIFDSTNYNTPEDIFVSFYDNHYNEEGVEYRILLAKAEDTINFSIEEAMGLDQDRYSSFPTNNGVNQFFLNDNQLDIKGNPILSNTSYVVYILLMPDPNSYYNPSMACSERKITISDPNYLSSGQKWGENISWFPCDDLFSDYLYWGGTGSDFYSNSSNIDVNRDGLADYTVYGEHRDSTGLTNDVYEFNIKGLRENKVLLCEHPNHDKWVDVLPKNVQFGDNNKFTQDESLLFFDGVHFGAWTELLFSYGHGSYEWADYIYEGINFVGFQINDSETTQYAWVKMEGTKFIEYGFQNLTNGIESNVKSEHNFEIFPNPSNGIFQIKSNENSDKKYSVTIINNLGVIIEVLEMNNSEIGINIESYPAGLYYIQISNNDGLQEIHKLIIN